MFGFLAKVFGRWGDDTAAIARRIAGRLEPGESVLAAVHVQVPGTSSAGIQGGASAGGDAAIGHSAGEAPHSDARSALWNRQAAALGIDADIARRTVRLVAAVTGSRLLLVRRNRLTGRMAETLAAWPLSEVDRLTVPRGGNSLRIFRGGADLRCELPNEHRFIAPVYRELPEIFARAQAAARAGGDSRGA